MISLLRPECGDKYEVSLMKKRKNRHDSVNQQMYDVIIELAGLNELCIIRDEDLASSESPKIRTTCLVRYTKSNEQIEWAFVWLRNERILFHNNIIIEEKKVKTCRSK